MTALEPVRSRPWRPPAVGGLALIGSALGAVLGVGKLTLVDVMLLLAVTVVVPLAVPLHPASRERSRCPTLPGPPARAVRQ